MVCSSTRPGRMRAGFLAVLLPAALQVAFAGLLGDRLAARREVLPPGDALEADSASGPASLPAGVRLLRNVAYGNDREQRMDVYLPRQAKVQTADAPVILMVHGGGWRNGDKAGRRVVENKVARWVPKGFVVVSVNYRMQSHVTPRQQADDVARALAAAQGKAVSWGADPGKFILMGHSAGAHLVALLGAAPPAAREPGAAPPWLGAVALDSAALDVPQIMNARHLALYDRAFGSDAASWAAASPYHQLTAGALPMLLVCSSQRRDSCAQASRFAARAVSLGVRAEALPLPLSHEEINEQLGLVSGYTAAVESFMGSLDLAVGQALKKH